MINLSEMQTKVRAWVDDKFPEGNTNAAWQVSRNLWPLFGIWEEAGECAHAVLKHLQGIRGMESEEAMRTALIDGICDIQIFILDFCDRNDIDLESELQKTFNKVVQRDFAKYPNNGVSS